VVKRAATINAEAATGLYDTNAAGRGDWNVGRDDLPAAGDQTLGVVLDDVVITGFCGDRVVDGDGVAAHCQTVAVDDNRTFGTGGCCWKIARSNRAVPDSSGSGSRTGEEVCCGAGVVQRGADRDFVAGGGNADIDDTAAAANNTVYRAGCFDADPACAVPAVDLAVVGV
jgi:hypothetical protein